VYFGVSAALALINTSIMYSTAAVAGAGVFEAVDGNSTLNNTTDKTSVISDNTGGCCFAAGYGISSQAERCDDIDNGDSRHCCTKTQYSNGTACIACSDTYNCTVLGITSAQVPLRTGHWRENLTVPRSRECWNVDACKGGVALSSTDEYCSEGYTGNCK
jgi:hypothetical protein